MNNIEKTYSYVKQKKSGFLWVAVGLALLVLAIPLMLYGLGRATYNGIVWVGERPERKLKKLMRKEHKAQLTDNIEQLKLAQEERKAKQEKNNE